MLRLENISAGYGKKQVLSNVTFTLLKGEILLIAGGNGSGKSTLLKAICGAIPMWKNSQVFLHDKAIAGFSTHFLVQRGLLYSPQKGNVFEELSVGENIELAGIGLRKQVRNQRKEKIFTSFPQLARDARSQAHLLSGGGRQILSIAMAMMHQPKIMLLDEPFTGLSPMNLNHVRTILQQLNQTEGIAMIIVEHRIRECLGFAKRLIGLKCGEIFNEFELDCDFDVRKIQNLYV